MRYCRIVLILAITLAAIELLLLIIAAPKFMTFLAVALFLIYRSRRKGRLDAFGTAEWASYGALKRKGMLEAGEGLCIGLVTGQRPTLWASVVNLFRRSVPAAIACEQLVMAVRQFNRPTPEPVKVRLNKVVHLAAFAPTGVGKGTSLILPFLLGLIRDSVVIYDPKGEACNLTAQSFRDRGYQVVVLDPYQVATKTPDGFNPLAMIDKDSPLVIDHARAMAAEMVVRTGNEPDPHWNDSAEAFIAAMIALTCLYGDGANRSLQAVRSLLTDPERMQAAIKVMVGDTAMSGMIARMGHQLATLKDKELASVLSTTNRHMRWLDTPAIANSTRESTFDPLDLTKKPLAVFVVLPVDQMKAQAGYLRLVMGSLLRACVAGGLQEQHKVHFVLDEAASLGEMDALEQALNIGRGYGIRIQLYYQSTGQLKKCWGVDGGDQVVLSNTTQIFFGVRDKDTAEYVSAMLGEETIWVESSGSNSGDSTSVNRNDPGGSFSVSRGRNTGLQQQARKLLKPEEVVALDERTAITLTPGVKPIATTLVRYYEEPLGNGAGRWRRLRIRVEVWLASILLLVVFSVLGAQMTRAMFHPQHPPLRRAAK
ncbi:Conjugal transfer protein TraG [Gemmata obscuriglobus]|nr:type IV secretory system conjugative DNA transfer family protein [Gemmata obscuriglobus]QEG30317.1 Conjugal transfer protein TraG [Gemmata obscuriglobus]VTS09641.1 type iv secretory 4 component : Type IV secretory pathway, VirD4 component OS=Singulisphaera acidiphila (strain ATCC BAA-1392 / DSM 18658 / VKM B-2454 / MOB10) GN=Sinac_7665 PE=4 SV=1: T4SS-DNA_transf [Gemmata obscuriglobus UQM 2246]